jgi:hypothetical protein
MTTDTPIKYDAARALDVPGALALLSKAVEQKGEAYVYPDDEKHRSTEASEGMCVYFTESGRPSCIAGHVFAHLGFGSEDVEEGTGVEEQPFSDLLNDDVVKVLSVAQEVQDLDIAWGEALQSALERAADLGYPPVPKED